MDKIKNIPITIYILGLLGMAAIASLWQETGGAMSGAMAQLGWCSADDFLCRLRYYSWVAISLIIIGLIFDILIRVKRNLEKDNIGQPSKPEVINTRFKVRVFHIERRVNANAEVINNYLLQHCTGIAY